MDFARFGFLSFVVFRREFLFRVRVLGILLGPSLI